MREWVGDYVHLRNEDKDATRRAGEAIAHMGTNALPWLIGWISYERPAWQNKIRGALQPGSALLGRIHLDWILSTKKEDLAAISPDAFEALGATAEPAISELTRMMNDPKAGRVSVRAAAALSEIGTNAFAALLPMLDSPRNDLKAEAIRGMANMGSDLGPNGCRAVPSLLRSLDGPDETMPTSGLAWSAALALGAMKLDPLAVVPALAKAAQNPGNAYRLRSRAIISLGRFGTEAGPSVPVLIECLDDTNWMVAMSAEVTLGDIRLEPQSVIPALTKAAQNEHFRIRQGAVHGLRRFGAEARASLPTITNLLSDPELGVRQEATNALRDISRDQEGEEQPLRSDGNGGMAH